MNAQRENFNTVRDVAHLSAFSHMMAARDEMNNRPVSLADFGGAKMFGDDNSSSSSSFDVTDFVTAATQGAASIISAIEGPGTTVYVGQTQPQYTTPSTAYNPQTGLPYGYSRPATQANNMMMYLALGGVALVALMFLTKKKSAPAAS